MGSQRVRHSWATRHTHPHSSPTEEKPSPFCRFRDQEKHSSSIPCSVSGANRAGWPLHQPAQSTGARPGLSGERAHPLRGGNGTPPTAIPLWWEVVRRAKGTHLHCTLLKRKQREAVLCFCQDGICRDKQKFNIYTQPVLQLYLTVSERNNVPLRKAWKQQ